MKVKTLQILWHEKQPVFSCDFEPNISSKRFATCGADSFIRTWKVLETSSENSTNELVEHLSSFSKHIGGVNVVRWHPKGALLASGGDDGSIIIWTQDETIATSNPVQQFGEVVDSPAKEPQWNPESVIYSPSGCSVFDIAWSIDGEFIASASDMDFAVKVFSVQTKQVVQQVFHTLFVQGVCWDPLGKYLISQSRDRQALIVSQLSFKKLTLVPINKSSKFSNPNSSNNQQLHLYHNESLLTFFRRPTFSPDGNLVLAPCGIFNELEQHVVYVYARNKEFKGDPVALISGLRQAATVVKFSPLKYQLKKSPEQQEPFIKLPYRMIFAIGTREEIVIHDTQHLKPLARIEKFHYDCMSDLTWSSDGLSLIGSSIDGFCTIFKFDSGELGTVAVELTTTTTK